MQKILPFLTCLVCCAPQKTAVNAGACNPVTVCNAATEGEFKYDQSKLYVCAPAAQTEKNAGEYGWQQVRWVKSPQAQQAQEQTQGTTPQPAPNDNAKN